MVLLVSCFN